MRHITLFDTTLRDGEQAPGCTMQSNEKLEVAKKLESLGVDVIEAGFPVTSKGDFQAVKRVAQEVRQAEICALARALPDDIETAYESVKDAASPRVHIFIATSPVHMADKLKLTEDEVIERIAASARQAKKRLNNVQFSFEDATRSSYAFLARATRTAIENGATTVNFADTVGYASPDEIRDMLEYIKNNVDLTGVRFGIHCHNDLGMAVANSLIAVKCGVNHVEGTLNGIGERSGNAAIEEIAMAIQVKSKEFDAYTSLKSQKIYSASKFLSSMLGLQIPVNKPIVGANVFLHESGIHQHGMLVNKNTYEIISPESIGFPKQAIVLGKHSGKHAFEEYLKDMHYQFEEKELETYFKQFKALCDKKKIVTRLDIEALVMGKIQADAPRVYSLQNFLIATKKDGAFATVTLKKDAAELACQAEGNGALDSSFCAVNRIIQKNLTLLDYSLHAVTAGEDALGEAVVKLSDGVSIVTGRGVSTDVIEASILAYVDGANKLTEEL